MNNSSPSFRSLAVMAELGCSLLPFLRIAVWMG